MGAQMSTAKTETVSVSKIVTDIIMSSSQNCAGAINSNQEMTFSNIKTRGCSLNFSDISQDANISQNFSCAQNSDNSSELQSKLKLGLDAAAEAATKGMTIGANSSNSETITNLKNDVMTNVNVSSIANCVASAIANQKILFGKIEADCRGSDDKSVTFNNIKQLITLTQVAKCIQENQQALQSVNAFENELKVKTSATTSGIDLPSLLASFGSGLIPCIIICILISCCSIFSSIMSSSSSSSSSSPSPSSPPSK